MAPWLRNTSIAILITGIVWSAAVAYWRTAPSLPSAPVMAAIMTGLPLLLVSSLWFGGRMRARPATPQTGAAMPAEATPAPAAPPAPALAILAASLRMPHASSPGELLAIAARGKARAVLDPELTGDDGYPIMSVRAAAADDEDGRERIAAWIDRHGERTDNLCDEHLRALLLAAGVTAELGAFAARTFAMHGKEAPAEGASLQLSLLLPSSWDVALCRAGAAFLRQSVVDNGWPDARLTVETIADVADLLPGGARHAPLTLLLACCSHVGDATVNAWSADLTLFSAADQQGLIPGEGAAALLLSSATDLSEVVHCARMSGAAALRDLSSDSTAGGAIHRSGRSDAQLLESLATRALQAANVPAPSLAAIVADTGHRTGRTMELMALAAAAAPHLDAGSDVLGIGTVTGSCGEAGVVAALALAAEQADTLGAPVLCVANEDPFRRRVLVVHPGTAQA